MENKILAKEVLGVKNNAPYCFSFVRWFKVGCMPKDGQAIVYVTTNNKIGMLAHANVESWDWHVRKYSIVGWCYSADLLPKALSNNI